MLCRARDNCVPTTEDGATLTAATKPHTELSANVGQAPCVRVRCSIKVHGQRVAAASKALSYSPSQSCRCADAWLPGATLACAGGRAGPRPRMAAAVTVVAARGACAAAAAGSRRGRQRVAADVIEGPKPRV